MGVQYTQNFKEDTVSYYNGHRELGMNGCDKNLGISKPALSSWVNVAKEH